MLQGLNEELALPLLTQRPVVRQNPDAVESIAQRKVMVTGAGGSIGSELCLQIAASQPSALILVDHSELNLYEINATLENSNLPITRIAALADIRDKNSLRFLFDTTRPDLVFHAAALKHVPLLENDHNLVEAVRTNVRGTKNVLDLCVSFGANFVLISTDKAVNPSSGMGLTKRVAEIYTHWQAACHHEIGVGQVRFGNVLGSSGSVVPLFRRQIAHGGPVTITHPEMTRFLMTIKEAVGLTIGAADLLRDRDRFGCFVLDMGQPVKIIDMARQLIAQSGLRAEIDIPIRIIGPRPGEKLHEELNYDWEPLVPTSLPGVWRADTAYRPEKAIAGVERLLLAAETRDVRAVKDALVEIVPEYVGEVVF